MAEGDSTDNKSGAIQRTGEEMLWSSVAAMVAYGITKDPVAAAAVGAGVRGIGARVSELLQERRERKLDVWFKTILQDETRPPEAIAEEIRENLRNPQTADVVARSIRAALETPDEAVVPALARLAKEYIGGSLPIDDFFRGASRMLAECDAEGLADLVTALTESAVIADNIHRITISVPWDDPVYHRIESNAPPAIFDEPPPPSPAPEVPPAVDDEAPRSRSLSSRRARGRITRVQSSHPAPARHVSLPHHRLARVVQRLTTLGLGGRMHLTGSDGVVLTTEVALHLIRVLGATVPEKKDT